MGVRQKLYLDKVSAKMKKLEEDFAKIEDNFAKQLKEKKNIEDRLSDAKATLTEVEEKGKSLMKLKSRYESHISELEDKIHKEGKTREVMDQNKHIIETGLNNLQEQIREQIHELKQPVEELRLQLAKKEEELIAALARIEVETAAKNVAQKALGELQNQIQEWEEDLPTEKNARSKAEKMKKDTQENREKRASSFKRMEREGLVTESHLASANVAAGGSKKRKCELTTSVTKTVDHRGGFLELGECGARMTIPPGALPEGVKETISFTLDYKKGCVPGQVTPVARCLPTGLKFKKLVTITVPNLEEQVDEECTGIILCNEEDSGQSPRWKESYNWFKRSRNHTTFYINHFSDYVMTDDNGKKYKKLIAVAYASKADWTQGIRWYIYNYRDMQAEKEVEKIEARLNGDSKGTSSSLLFYEENKQDITVQLVTDVGGWKQVSQSEKKIPFKDIWHIDDGDFVQRPFMLMNSERKDGNFYCSLALSVKQGQNEKEELDVILISNPVKLGLNAIIESGAEFSKASITFLLQKRAINIEVDNQEGGLKQEFQTIKTEMNQLKESVTSMTRGQSGASSFMPPGSFHPYPPVNQLGATIQQLPMQQLQPPSHFRTPHTLREGDQQRHAYGDLVHNIPQMAPSASTSNAASGHLSSNQFGGAQRIPMQQLPPSSQFGPYHTLREDDQQPRAYGDLAHTIHQTAQPASASNATPDPSSLGLGMAAQAQYSSLGLRMVAQPASASNAPPDPMPMAQHGSIDLGMVAQPASS